MRDNKLLEAEWSELEKDGGREEAVRHLLCEIFALLGYPVVLYSQAIWNM